MRRFNALFVPFALAACSAPAPKRVAPPPPPPPVAATDAGCLDIVRIREAKVIDDRTIDFHMNDGRTVRSTMPAACAGLGLEKAFTYSTTVAKLCPGTRINVINQTGGPRLGTSCALGAFAVAAPTP